MNQQTKWKELADKQHQQSLERMRQEQQYQNKLKHAYMDQLRNQMTLNQTLKKRQLQLEKQHQKQLLNQNIQRHKKQIITEKTREQILEEKYKTIQYEGQKLQNQKNDKAKRMKMMEMEMERNSHEQALYLENMRKRQQFKKKEQFRKSLIGHIEMNRQLKNLTIDLEKKQQRQLLNEGENRKLKEEIHRLKFYHDLRQRSKVVDYGSHSTVDDLYKKKLVEKKKQEWNTSKELLEMQQRLKQHEQNARYGKATLQKNYREQLYKQVEYNEHMNKMRLHQKELQKMSIDYSHHLLNNAIESERELQKQKQRQLAQFLRDQEFMNKKNRVIDNEMKQSQQRLNIELLKKQNKKLTSMDIYQMDYHRKKQLSFLQNSFNTNRNKMPFMQEKQPNYFAKKGINIIN